MSWLFSQALVAEYLADTCLDGGPYAPLSVMLTAQPFSRRGKTMDVSSLSQFGQTCAPLTESHGTALLTSYLEAFHAQTSVPLGKEPELLAANLASGNTWLGSSLRFNLHTHGWRTAQCSLLEDSEPFSGTWPRSGLMHDGTCWEQRTSAFRTSGTGCGYSLPTPTGVNGGRNNMMGRVDEWGGSSNPLRGTVIGSMCLPAFEEMVMGWPIGWTEPTPYATVKFHEWQQQHGGFSPPHPLNAAA
jgi:hypothetical protein